MTEITEDTVTDATDAVRDHYGATGLTKRLAAALAVFGSEDTILKPEQLAGLDQFHTRGLAATADLADLAGISAADAVVDVGAGVGGPARWLAANRGCHVVGVDLSEPFVEAAQYLTRRTALDDRVTFRAASALALPFEEGTFDVALLQHVAMNIADRHGLYREVHRVVRPGGRFATYDVVEAGGAPHYPVPWATTPVTSTLLSAQDTQAAIQAAGFRPLTVRDDGDLARTWAAALRAGPPTPEPNLGLVIGPQFAQYAANLGRSLAEGRVGIFTAVFEAI